MKIDLYCNDGSPLGVIPSMIYGRGVGGAELAMLTLVQYLARRGHKVRVFNNPQGGPGPRAGVEFLMQSQFRPMEDRDIFIIFRSPNPFVRTAVAGAKIHWSCDQYTVGNYGRDIFPHVDRVVCISPYHLAYHKRTYGLDSDIGTYIDLGVNIDDYEVVTEEMGGRILKVPGRCLWCSVPSRGIPLLAKVWPVIKETVPWATLVVTGDYRLWGAPSANDLPYRKALASQPGVEYLGKIPRMKLVQQQLEAELLIGPLDYEELFCIAAAEGQVASCIPITSSQGALPSTNMGGVLIPGSPGSAGFMSQYTHAVIDYLTDQQKRMKDAKKIKRDARKRFSWERITDDWEKTFEEVLIERATAA